VSSTARVQARHLEKIVTTRFSRSDSAAMFFHQILPWDSLICLYPPGGLSLLHISKERRFDVMGNTQ